MPYELRLPDLGEGLTEGEIARWLVAEDQPLVEIQTDKTTVEIPSPSAGVVSRVLAAEGDVVPVGQVILVIGDGAGADADRPRAGDSPSAVSRTVVCGRRRSFAAWARSSASISRAWRAPVRRGGSPRRTCARRPRAAPRRSGASASAGSGA